MEITGTCELYSETGTEGGHWAVYDPSNEKLVPPKYGVWPDTDVWDAQCPERHGRTGPCADYFLDEEWVPIPDPIRSDPDYFPSTLFQGQSSGDREADKRLAERYGFEIEYDESRDYGVPRTRPQRPYGVSYGGLTRVFVEWDDDCEERQSDTLLVKYHEYAGLHLLRDGDELTVYDKDDPEKVVWSGYWLHTGPQKGVDKETWARWFLEGWPCRLVRHESPAA